MKLGFVSAILDGWTFEEMIDTASEMGFSCVEVACWPQGRAERRYAGVSHIDVDSLSDEKAAYILNYCKEGKPVYEKYQKIFFKKTKEKFKQEHPEVARYEKSEELLGEVRQLSRCRLREVRSD